MVRLDWKYDPNEGIFRADAYAAPEGVVLSMLPLTSSSWTSGELRYRWTLAVTRRDRQEWILLEAA
jgi:hypothetical protein